MSGDVSAMFPLSLVLFPHVALPLRIFEPRYRVMLRDCLAGDRTFGVALIAKGREVGGGDERFDVATLASIIHADVADDGQALVIVAGQRRVRVDSWLSDDPYPRATVQVVHDPDMPQTDDVAGLARRLRRVLAWRSEHGRPAAPATTPIDDDPEVAMWQLCALLPCAPHDDLALLASPSASARLALVSALLDVLESDTAS